MPDAVPVARTRITVPPSLPRLAPRPRLLQRLGTSSFTALVAGPGYGKSTLVAQWVATLDMPCAWYALVDSDDEPYRFVSHLLAACGESASDPAAWRGAIDNALNALASHASVVVLDDVHHLESIEVTEILGYFVRFLPPTTRLVMTSRTWPDRPPWSGWVARGQVDIVDATDLSLTADEVPVDDVEHILALTGGWPLAVDFLTHQRLRSAVPSPDALKTLILTEVWDHLSTQDQDYLLQCSLVDTLSPGPILERLSRQGAFVRWWPDGSYRIHDLFRDFLRARLHSDIERARRGHRAAAASLPDLEAVPHWIAAGEEARAIEILSDQATELLACGRHRHLLDLLQQIEHPPLELRLAAAHALRQGGEYEAALVRYREVAAASTVPMLLSQALGGEAQVYVDTVQPALAGDLLRQAYRLTADVAARSRLLQAIAENALNEGRAHAAARYRRLAGRTTRTTQAPFEARIWLRMGHLQTARTLLRDRARTDGAGLHREDTLVLSYIAALEGHSEEAESLAREGLALAQKVASIPTEAVAWMRLGHALQLRDDEAAVACYLRGLELSRQTGIERLQAEALMGQALLQGDVPASYQAATDGLAITQRAGDAWLSAWLRLVSGIAGVRGGHPQARTLLEQGLQGLQHVRDRFGVAVARLWLQTDGAAASCVQAGYGFLLERRTLFGPPLQPVPAVARLRIQCLGAFRVFHDGVVLSPRAWKREKARELFLLLVTRRQRLVQKEELMDLLWPDATAAAANRDFRVALHALSDALDPDRPRHALARCIERQGTAYGFHLDETTSLDVQEFERLLDEGLPHKAIELYQGDFLEEYAYSEWAAGERDRLRSRFLEAADRLARNAFAAGEDDVALQAAFALLAREKAWEAAWQIIIGVHIRHGRAFMAQRAYEQCVEALQEELGVEPSPATATLVQQGSIHSSQQNA